MDWGGCLESVSGTEEQVVTIACVPQLLSNIINAAFIFAGIVALAFIIWGAFKIARSGGDPKQLETARHTIMYAIIGLILVFFSIFIVRLISVVTGVSCINLDVIGFDTCADHTTDIGCFQNTDPDKGAIIEDPTCFPYSPNNSPKEPLRWYDTQEQCETACRELN